MQIHITRGEDSSGPYSLEEVQKYLAEGILLPDDMAWHEGLEEWVSLSQVVTSAAPVTPQPIPAPPQPEVTTTLEAQSAVPADLVSPQPQPIEPASPQPTAVAPKAKSKKMLVVGIVVGLLVLGGVAAGSWIFLFKEESPDNAKVEGEKKLAEKTKKSKDKTNPGGTNPTIPEPPLPEALAQLEEKAKKGDVDAQVELGHAYDYGEGVAKNSAKAMEWYRKAALQGDDLAQYNMAASLSLGEGISAPDKVGAYAWSQLASSKMELAQELKAELAKELTQAELAQALDKVAELRNIIEAQAKEPVNPETNTPEPLLPPLPGSNSEPVNPETNTPKPLLPPLPEPTPEPGTDTASAAILDKAVRANIRKPDGELTAEDFARVKTINIFASLRGPKVKDLDYLRQCPNLQAIFLQGHEVKDLTPLINLTSLTKINLSSNQVSDLSPLAKLPVLKELWMQRNGLASVAPLASLKTLEKLYLDGNKIQDLDPVVGLSRLQILGIDGNQVEDLKPLAGLVKLERLTITGNPIKRVDALAKLVNLKSLTFSPPVGTDFEAALGGLGQLESISVGRTTLRDLAGLVGALKNRDSFTSLMIDNCGVEDISALAQLKNLTSLQLMRNEIRDVSSLSGMTRLSTLILSQNKVTDLRPLAEVPNLGTLWLSGNQFKDISPLMKLKKLRMVTIRSSLVPSSQLEELRKAIPGCRVDNKAAAS